MIDIKELQDLQDLAWCSISKELKEVVKNYYQYALKYYQVSGLQKNIAKTLEHLFGLHNLTSDAEGEEMLMVSRKDVQKIYKESKHIVSYEAYGSKVYSMHLQIMCVLENLFGSKCLPDNVDTSHGNVDSLEPKPAEPKFKMGDTASYVCSPTLKHKCTVTKVMQNGHSGKWEYNVIFEWGKHGMWIPESDLEPYTEPTANYLRSEGALNTAVLAGNYSSASTCDKQFDNIIKDGFKNHNRLHIAAILAAGMLANDNRCYPVDRALELADALIAKSKERRTE